MRIKEIARAGKYSLRYCTYIDGRKVTTHDLEICEDLPNGSVMSICYIKNGSIISVENRLMTGIHRMVDADNVKKLISIMYAIIDTDKVEVVEFDIDEENK